MQKNVQVHVAPERRDDTAGIVETAIRKAGLSRRNGLNTHILKRSIDARRGKVKYVYQVAVWDDEEDISYAVESPDYRMVDEGEPVHIIGAGPAGYFAGLECLKLGLKPVILERGKDVRARRRDLRAIQQFSTVDPDSNYCFGEGGAGTYSDGKLYTRSTKRGNVREVLETLVLHGANPDILIDAHPHIGSNKLPKIITGIRETILQYGGEVHFGARVTGLQISSGKISAIEINGSEELKTSRTILATGHSARDIYTMLNEGGVRLELKPFALGVRIEHPQALIDSIQYSRKERGEYLPAAAYSLACQVDEQGVYSFCMCPGGLVVPAATAPGEIVVNGMSLSRRDSAYANAGTVVEVGEELIHQYCDATGPLDAMRFQAMIEKRCFEAGNGSQAAPAQRLTDFVSSRLSADLPSTSYIPGLLSVRVDSLLPREIIEPLQKAVRKFDRRMKGYFTSEAVVIATESRTSAPVRIPRESDSLMHPDIQGFFPCGEGAGYAGGIVSAAVDGKRVARAVARTVQQPEQKS